MAARAKKKKKHVSVAAEPRFAGPPPPTCVTPHLGEWPRRGLRPEKNGKKLQIAARFLSAPRGSLIPGALASAMHLYIAIAASCLLFQPAFFNPSPHSAIRSPRHAIRCSTDDDLADILKELGDDDDDDFDFSAIDEESLRPRLPSTSRRPTTCHPVPPSPSLAAPPPPARRCCGASSLPTRAGSCVRSCRAAAARRGGDARHRGGLISKPHFLARRRVRARPRLDRRGRQGRRRE